MFTLNPSAKFSRKAKKLLKNNEGLQKALDKTFEILEENPLHQSLRSHKVKDRNGDSAFSSRVTNDIRIIWNYNDEEVEILDLLDIGGHSGKDKVYS